MHKYFALFIFLYLYGAFLSGIYEQSVLNTDATGYLSYVMGYKVDAITDIDIFVLVNPFSDLWRSFIPKMLTWNYFFLEGNYEWARFFILIPMSGLFMLGLSMLFIQVLQGFIRR